MQYRNSHPEVFSKKGVLKNLTKFIRKHLCHSILFNKVAGLRPNLTSSAGNTSETVSHPATSRRGVVVATSLYTFQQRNRYISNETPSDVSLERRQVVSVVRPHDILLERLDDVLRGRNNDVPLVRLHDISNKSQMKHPTTSQWCITKTSQWYVSMTSHYNVSTMSPISPQ